MIKMYTPIFREEPKFIYIFFDVRQKNYYLKSPLWRQTGFKKIEIKQEIISLTRLLLKDVTKHIALNKKRESIPED